MAPGFRLLWLLLLTVRLVWSLWPQTGYIHPDEFFQSLEVVAGDVLGLEVHRSWEFNSTSPIRSIMLPYATCTPALFILRLLNRADLLPTLGLSLSHLLLVLPRLTMAVLSIGTDTMMHSMATRLHVGPGCVAAIYASSYVTLVYLTRTFSNTIEAFLFTSLLFVVVRSTSWNDEDSDKIDKNTHHSLHKGSLFNFSGELKQCLFVGVILTAGVFNRPTFLAFALIPCAYWLLRPFPLEGQVHVNMSLAVGKQVVMHLLRRSLTTALFAVHTALLFIVADTAYFKSLDICDIFFEGELSGISIEHLVITPLNFLLYNTQSSNLAEHGIHPRVTHACVNLPILFGPLFWLLLVELIRPKTPGAATRTASRMEREIQLLLLCSIVVPVMLLSAFPHQEPRFLIPVLAPMVLLSARRLCASRTWTCAWIVFNVLACIVYGIVHQGGLLSAILHLNKALVSDPGSSSAATTPASTEGMDAHLIFYHTYMPPRCLFLLPKDQHQEVQQRGRVNIVDLKGAPKEQLKMKLQQILMLDANVKAAAAATAGQKNMVFLVLPGSVYQNIHEYLQESVTMRIDKSFFPHVSFEDLPELKGFSIATDQLDSSRTFQATFQQQFSLLLIRVESKS